MKILKNNINKTILGVVLAIFIIGTGLYTLAAIKEPSKAKTEKTVKMKRTITDDYMVQESLTNFSTRPALVGTCGTVVSTRYCRYTVTDEGKENIPTQDTPYTTTQIDSYVAAGYLVPHPTATLRVWNP